MYLAKLQTIGFRSLDNFEMEFGAGLNVIVGPNNAGKTAIIEAISLVLSSIRSNPAREIFVNSEDFWHSLDGKEREDREFKISLDIRDIPDEAIGTFGNWLLPNETVRTARITLICRRDSDDPDDVKPMWRVGEKYVGWSDEDAIRRLMPVFLPPLRDAETNLRPGRRSRLARLVQHIVDDAAGKSIEAKFGKIQQEIITQPPFSTAIGRINDRLAKASGSLYKQTAHLKFLDPEFRRITEALQVRIGLDEMSDFALTENGLGYNNLLYIATILSQLSKDSKQDLRLLLIEEPEAHLHPQMQQVLVDALIDASNESQIGTEKQTQVIMTSHSPLLVAHVPVERVTVLHQHQVESKRRPEDTSRLRKGKPLARSVGQFQLEQSTLDDLSRYLDSTKANLFFANGVLLVEGIAETLLLPEFAKAINRPLNEYHVSIVNVDGLAFAPFLELFNSLQRLQIPCAVITDSDPRFRKNDRFYRPRSKPAKVAYNDTAEDEVDGDEILFPVAPIDYGRAYALEQKTKQQPSGARVFRNLKTLEYDLALTNYLEHMLAVYETIDLDMTAEMETATAAIDDPRKRAIRFYKRFDPEHKGEFAQKLAANLESSILKHLEGERTTRGEDRTKWASYRPLPSYLDQAIKWVTGDCSWD